MQRHPDLSRRARASEHKLQALEMELEQRLLSHERNLKKALDRRWV
jgi:hypothetical protein